MNKRLLLSNNMVTVITPTYNIVQNNRTELLKNNIKSVQMQEEEIEHIIIDGGSTDGTIDLINELKKEFRIKYISENDKGIYDAMNKGINMARGEYISFLNSDDKYICSDALDLSIYNMKKSRSDFSYADAQVLASKGNSVLYTWKGDINELPFGRHFCHQTMIIKTDVIRAYNGFDLKYKISADSDLVCKLIANNVKSVHTNKLVVAYKDGGISSKNSEIIHTEHSDSFYNHIGKELCLSLEECFLLYRFTILETFDKQRYVTIFDKLMRININWAKAYKKQIFKYLHVDNFEEITNLNWKIYKIRKTFFNKYFIPGTFVYDLVVKIYHTL